MTDFASTLKELFATGTPTILVTVATAKGSTPREEGAAMAVTAADHVGTIGGGQLEWMAIDHARQLLSKKTADWRMALPLGPEIGQCCGGHVDLSFVSLSAQSVEAFAEADARTRNTAPQVLIFGAGHTGRALAAALKLLPLKVTLIDGRAEELSRAPEGTRTALTALPEAEVRAAPTGSAFVVLTHDHALDFLITREALLRGDAAYIGLIGSRTKRISFERWAQREEGGTPNLDRLICPIGGKTVRDKRPEVIAALTATEILTALMGNKQKSDRGAHHDHFTTAS